MGAVPSAPPSPPPPPPSRWPGRAPRPPAPTATTTSASRATAAAVRAELRLKADHGAIRVEFEVESRRARERWRVVLVHERRVVWRGRARTRDGGSFRIRRSIPDFDGVDEVSVRASGPRGNTCQATATLTAAQG